MSRTLYQKSRARLGYLGVGTCAATLAAVGAMGDAGARAGAVFGAIGMGAGLTAVARAVRSEHADDAEPAGWAASLREAARWTGVAWFGIAAFVALSYLATTHHPPRAVAAVAAAVAALAIGATFAVLTRRTWAEGVEREHYLRATSTTFIIVMVGAAGYGVFELAVGAPRLSMWWVYGTGMAVWAVLSGVYRRQLS